MHLAPDSFPSPREAQPREDKVGLPPPPTRAQAQGSSGLRDRRPKEEEGSREKRERAHGTLLWGSFSCSQISGSQDHFTLVITAELKRAFGYVGFIYQYHIRNSN